MIRLETQLLGGFNETAIDEPALFEVTKHNGDSIGLETILGNTPAVVNNYDGYFQPQLAISTDLPSDVEVWDERIHYPAGRLSHIHGRTVEVLAGKVAVEDQFGNHYQSVSIKGADLSDPHIFKSETASRDFIIYGLQESLVIERVIRASKLLRENGIPTEYVFGLVMPEKFPMEVPGEASHRQLVELPKLVEALAADYASRVADGSKSTLEIKSEMIEKFHDVDYLITYRAMDTPYRLGELGDFDKVEEFYDFLIRNNENPDLDERLEELHPASYIACELADELGKTVAKMHKLGLTHGFLHKNNISALSSLLDLDSCRGEPLGLGDDPISDKDMYKDVAWAMGAIAETLQDMQPSNHDDINGFLVMQDYQHYSSCFFLSAYLNERFEEQAEKEAFLAGMVFDRVRTFEEDYGNFARFCERITGAFCSLNKGSENTVEVEESNVPDLDSYEIKLGRSDTIFRSVPARYFKEAREQILSNAWIMNEEYPDFKHEERNLHNPIQAAVRNISLKLFVDHAKDSALAENPAQFLAALNFGSSIGNVDPAKVPVRNKAIYNYFIRQSAAIVDRLSDEYSQDDKPVMQLLLNKGLGHIKDQAAVMRINETTEVPLLYLNNQLQYQMVFSALGLKPESRVSYIRVGDAMRQAVEFPDDTVFLVDYKIAQYIAEAQGSEKRSLSIFGYRPNYNRLVILKGLMTGELEVSLAHYEELEDPEIRAKIHEESERLAEEDLEAEEKPRPALPVVSASTISEGKLSEDQPRLFSLD